MVDNKSFWRSGNMTIIYVFVVGILALLLVGALFLSPGRYSPYYSPGEALLATQIHDLQADVNALRTEVAAQRNAR